MCLTSRCKTANLPFQDPGPYCIFLLLIQLYPLTYLVQDGSSSSLPARGNFSLMNSLGICTSHSLLIGYYLIISCSAENKLQSTVFRLQGSTHESPANFSHNGGNRARAQVFRISLKVTNPIHESPTHPTACDLPKAHFLRTKHWELGLNI